MDRREADREQMLGSLPSAPKGDLSEDVRKLMGEVGHTSPGLVGGGRQGGSASGRKISRALVDVVRAISAGRYDV